MKSLIGDKIKYLRLENGYTQPELASKIGVSNGLISLWENNINEPKASLVAKLAIVFNISSDFLLGLEDEIKIQTPGSYEIENNGHFLFANGNTKFKYNKK